MRKKPGSKAARLGPKNRLARPISAPRTPVSAPEPDLQALQREQSPTPNEPERIISREAKQRLSNQVQRVVNQLNETITIAGGQKIVTRRPDQGFSSAPGSNQTPFEYTTELLPKISAITSEELSNQDYQRYQSSFDTALAESAAADRPLSQRETAYGLLAETARLIIEDPVARVDGVMAITNPEHHFEALKVLRDTISSIDDSYIRLDALLAFFDITIVRNIEGDPTTAKSIAARTQQLSELQAAASTPETTGLPKADVNQSLEEYNNLLQELQNLLLTTDKEIVDEQTLEQPAEEPAFDADFDLLKEDLHLEDLAPEMYQFKNGATLEEIFATLDEIDKSNITLTTENMRAVDIPKLIFDIQGINQNAWAETSPYKNADGSFNTIALENDLAAVGVVETGGLRESVATAIFKLAFEYDANKPANEGWTTTNKKYLSPQPTPDFFNQSQELEASGLGGELPPDVTIDLAEELEATEDELAHSQAEVDRLQLRMKNMERALQDMETKLQTRRETGVGSPVNVNATLARLGKYTDAYKSGNADALERARADIYEANMESEMEIERLEAERRRILNDFGLENVDEVYNGILTPDNLLLRAADDMIDAYEAALRRVESDENIIASEVKAYDNLLSQKAKQLRDLEADLQPLI